MNNKPVAWMYERPSGASKLSFVQEKMLWDDMKETPLYTHPVKEPMMVLDGNRVYPAFKELTDKEILSLTGFKDNPYDIFIEYEKEDLIEFARAILRKAQEK